MRLIDMFFDEIEDAKKRRVPFVIPIGTIEYHGHHLSNGTDTLAVTGCLRELEKEKHITILSPDEHTQLRNIVERRNFWCHSCYYDLVFDRKTGGLAKVQDVQMLIEDLKTAEQWRDRLYKKKIEYIKSQKS